MTNSSFTFLRVRGIAIGAHWSWLLVLGLVVWSLAGALFPSNYPGLSDAAYIVMGIVAGVLFFGSILLHELGHAFRALREGLEMDGITLWLFGGVARFKGMFPSAGAEFRIAVAGPVVSVALAAGFAGAMVLGDSLGWSDPVQGVVDYLWRINAIVVAFNLVPALPLDGGRILRSFLWYRQADFATATRSAARAGKTFGGLLATVGVLNLISGTGGTGGLWLVFLGWFLVQAAQAEASIGVIEQALRGYRVRDLMTPDPLTVASTTSVAAFLEEAVRRRRPSHYPVVEDGDLKGSISIRRAGEVPSEERSSATVGSAMRRMAVLDPDAGVLEVMGALQEEPRRAAVVDRDGSLVGVVSASDVARVLEIEATRAPARTARSRRASIAVWTVVAAAFIGIAGYLYNPSVIVVEPGAAFDVSEDITIDGIETDDVEGRYILTSVTLSQPNGWGLLWAALNGREIVSPDQVIPPSVDEEDYFSQQRAIFDESQTLAAAAAAQASGLEVTVNGRGTLVEQVLPGSPASEHLEPGDVIVSVDETDIELTTDLQSAIRARPAGSTFDIVVRRDGQRRTFQIASERLPESTGGSVGIGVVISTAGFTIDLPFDIDFKRRAIGGPSAGLIYALAITDMLDPGDLAGGRIIAGTGTIDAEGNIGEIGGVQLKAEAAKDAGAALFLVPASQRREVNESGLPTSGVATLAEALRALRATT